MAQFLGLTLINSSFKEKLLNKSNNLYSKYKSLLGASIKTIHFIVTNFIFSQVLSSKLMMLKKLQMIYI